MKARNLLESLSSPKAGSMSSAVMAMDQADQVEDEEARNLGAKIH